MVKISVVIPVFNVEKYLPECLESVLGQTFDEIEVIAVDDGSTDESGRILDEYAAKDSRLRVIHQQNAGVSAARNAGLDVAIGEYISFVDGDDYLDRKAFAELAEEVVKAPETDVFVFGFRNVCGGSVRCNKAFLDKLSKYAENGGLKRDFILELGGSVWTKLFKRRFIENHHIRFVSGVVVAEDGLFCMECAAYNPIVRVVRGEYYFYRIFRENSTMTAQYNLDREFSCREYLIKQPFYLNATREDRLVMDMKVCANLIYRYELLFYENRLKNLGFLEKYRQYLEHEYTKNELNGEAQYKRLVKNIKFKGAAHLTVWQKIFSIKNTRDKQYKEVRVLGVCFLVKRINALLVDDF